LALRALLREPSASPRSLGDLVEFESQYVLVARPSSLSTDSVPSFDRFRAALKGSWKDEPRPASGQTYDLGPHLIDQTLCLFGRPKSITAFVENVRVVGDPTVDDSVCFIFTLLDPPA